MPVRNSCEAEQNRNIEGKQMPRGSRQVITANQERLEERHIKGRPSQDNTAVRRLYITAEVGTPARDSQAAGRLSRRQSCRMCETSQEETNFDRHGDSKSPLSVLTKNKIK